MDYARTFSDMGPVGWGVLGCLILLSVYSIALMIEKHRSFRIARRQSTSFLPTFSRYLREGKLKEAIELSRSHERSHLARVVTAGAKELVGPAAAGRNPGSRVEAVARALDRATSVASADLRRGLGGLATIGSTAPFIGLLGTVIGIIHAFQGIAETGSGGIGAVSGGIAEALVATALGLFVAIPAVMAFNYFTSVLERLQVEMSTASAEMLDFLLKQNETIHASR